MFAQAFPAVAMILMFIVLAIQSLPILWSAAWWIVGCLCAVVLSYVKGESFGGGARYVVGIMVVGMLGFILIPFAIPAVLLIALAARG